jgi:hypothetical protein
MLFNLLTLTTDEKERYLAKTSSIVECVLSAKIWAEKRGEISKTLNEFYTRQELVVCALCRMLSCRYLPKFRTSCPISKLGKAIVRRHNSMMTEHFLKRRGPKSKAFSPKIRKSMFQCVTDFFVIDTVHRFPTYVYDIETPLDELQDAVISDTSRAPAVCAYPHKSVLVLTYRAQWLTVLTIQTSMLIQGILEIVKVTTDIETRNHLKSMPVWEAALAYASLF